MNSKLCTKEQCTGCYACFNICPEKCITMSVDDDKCALYPGIDSKKCIDCGLCSRVCPSLNSPEYHKPLKVLAAVCKDEKIYKNSSSGGVAYFISKSVIENGGIVYATDYTDELEVIFRRYTNINDLKKSQGSKYVHSHIKTTYEEIKSDLKNNFNVLFIALPCQIAGLLGFLNHKKYPNLLTVDLVCHGTPDYFVFNEYSKYVLKKNYKKAKYVKFRDGKSYVAKFIDSNNSDIADIPHRQNIYITHFLDGVIYRDNCYECKYARPERISDITLGDFWGLEENALKTDTQFGVNCVLLNTEKGNDFFYSEIDHFHTAEKKFDDVAKNNGQLTKPTEKTKYNYKFKKLLKKHNVITALIHCHYKKYLFICIRNFVRKNETIFKNLSKIKFLRDKI